MKQQSLRESAPSQSAQFAHHLDLLSSHSDSQCRDSLAYLTAALAACRAEEHAAPASPPPQPWALIVPKLLPLMTRASTALRAQLLKLFRTAMPPHAVQNHIQLFATHVRTALTSLAAEIRQDGLEILSWLLDTAGLDLVASRGGWPKLLKCFVTVLGWNNSSINRAVAATTTITTATATSTASRSRNTGSSGGPGRGAIRQLQVFGQFLQCGIGVRRDKDGADERRVGNNTVDNGLEFMPLWHAQQHMLPRKANCFAYLNIFQQLSRQGPQDARGDEDESNLVCEDRKDRQRLLRHYQSLIQLNLESNRKQGGEHGRVAAIVLKILHDNMKDYVDDS